MFLFHVILFDLSFLGSVRFCSVVCLFCGTMCHGNVVIQMWKTILFMSCSCRTKSYGVQYAGATILHRLSSAVTRRRRRFFLILWWHYNSAEHFDYFINSVYRARRLHIFPPLFLTLSCIHLHIRTRLCLCCHNWMKCCVHFLLNVKLSPSLHRHHHRAATTNISFNILLI